MSLLYVLFQNLACQLRIALSKIRYFFLFLLILSFSQTSFAIDSTGSFRPTVDNSSPSSSGIYSWIQDQGRVMFGWVDDDHANPVSGGGGGGGGGGRGGKRGGQGGFLPTGTYTCGYTGPNSSSTCETTRNKAAGTGYFSTNSVCPTNYTPIVVLTPIQMASETPNVIVKSINTGSGSACIGDNDWVNGNVYPGIKEDTTAGTYKIGYFTSPMADESPGASFNWTLYCTDQLSSTQTSYCASPTGIPTQPVLWEAGSIRNNATDKNWNPGTGGEQQTASTRTRCPTNWDPYIRIMPTKVHSHWQNQNIMLQGFGACVNSITVSGTHYNFGYLAVRRYTTVDYSNFIMFEGDGPSFSYSKPNATYPPNYTIPGLFSMPDASRLHTINVNKGNNIYDWQVGGLEYELLCYPPSATPPSLQAGCVGGTSYSTEQAGDPGAPNSTAPY